MTKIMDSRYEELRREFDARLSLSNPIPESRQTITSPSGKYQLMVEQYSRGPGTWSYSRGIVSRSADGKFLADVKRNYSQFWHCWVEHPNGKEYLLCGEDYQGYSIVNLTDETYQVYFPEEGYKGHGFCWTGAILSPDKLTLAIDGCYWACPYEIVLYDFREPEDLPYLELARCDFDDYEGWVDNQTFALTRTIETRASDNQPFDMLSEAEQIELTKNRSLIADVKQRVELRRMLTDDLGPKVTAFASLATE